MKLDETKLYYSRVPVWIRHFKESLPQELSSAVRDLTISFHFTKPEFDIQQLFEEVGFSLA